jgi:hypothetical protein
VKVVVNLGAHSGEWLTRSKVFAVVIRFILRALVMVDQLYLRLHPQTPSLYQSGVRYQEEPDDGIEEFASIPAMYARGWGDCDDLAPARVAELRMRGEKASIRVQWRSRPGGRKLYHVLVRRGDGSIEDPSAKLGMR